MQYQNLGILQEKKYHVLGIIEERRKLTFIYNYMFSLGINC